MSKLPVQNYLVIRIQKILGPFVILKVRRNVENPLSTRIQHRIAKLQSNTTCPLIFKVILHLDSISKRTVINPYRLAPISAISNLEMFLARYIRTYFPSIMIFKNISIKWSMTIHDLLIFVSFYSLQ